MEIISRRVLKFTTQNNHYQWKDSRQRNSWRGLMHNKVLSLVVFFGLFSLHTSNSSYVNQSLTQNDQQECPTQELNTSVVYVEFSSQIVKNGISFGLTN